MMQGASSVQLSLSSSCCVKAIAARHVRLAQVHDWRRQFGSEPRHRFAFPSVLEIGQRQGNGIPDTTLLLPDPTK
jgi:hypothetical protein